MQDQFVQVTHLTYEKVARKFYFPNSVIYWRTSLWLYSPPQAQIYRACRVHIWWWELD